MARNRRKPSLGVILTILITSFVLSTGVLINLVSFRGSRDSIEYLVTSIMTDTRNRIIEDSIEFLYDGSDAIGFLANVIEESPALDNEQLVNQIQPEVLLGFLTEFMDGNPQFLSAAFTAINGTQVRIVREEDDSLTSYTLLPNGNDVDPRESQWFRDALANAELVWTDGRDLEIVEEAGLTAALPIFQSGTPIAVISLDIGLRAFSDFLGASPGLNAVTFIVDPINQTIIANSQNTQTQKQLSSVDPSDGSLISSAFTALRPRIQELSQTAIGEQSLSSAMETAADRSIQLNIDHDDRRYISSFSIFPRESGWNWAIGVLVPQDEILGNILNSVYITLAISGAIMISGIIMSIAVGRFVSRPLRLLASEMREIQQFKLDQDRQIPSRIKEVHEMTLALDSMKTGLKSFRKYVPADLVRQLIQMGREANLGGEEKRLAIFFSDIAGFTSISEKMEPAELVTRLAEYLGALSDVIEKYNGTVDKYIGDAIMAFWGAPEDLENPDILAVEAAMECQKTAKEISQRWNEEGLGINFSIRIGLNSGDLIVGNLGSETRLNYTVIGDSVNVASRLEGANKYYSTEIMISESTYERVSDTIACRVIDKVQVKGKSEPILVYEPIAQRSQLSEDQGAVLELHQEAWELYLSRQFKAAALKFKDVYHKNNKDPLAKIHFERCKAFLKQPPAEDWNGVFALKEK